MTTIKSSVEPDTEPDTVPDMESVRETEQKLWTEYMVALARHQENWRLGRESWRNYVLADLRSTVRENVWQFCQDMHDSSHEQMQQAYLAWKRVAYPLHNIPLRDDEK